MRKLFYNLPRTLKNCFRGYNLFVQLMAAALTFIIVVSGFDWIYYTWTRSPDLRVVILPAVIVGGLLPILGPLLILLIGKIKQQAKTVQTAWGLGQAVLMGWTMSSFYKAFTGRIPPNLLDSQVDISTQFQFGFLRGGIFWGWPSSHTTIAFAMAMTLWVLYPKNKLIKTLSFIYALYIGLGISVSIHWFSEFIAGMLLGSVIGISVGKNFRDQEVKAL